MGAKNRTIRQVDSTDCGPACLGTVLNYFGRVEPLYRLREYSGTTHGGTSMLGLMRAATKLNLEAKAYSADLEGIAKLTLPLILHWEHNHFVVLFKVSKNKALIGDPAEGSRWVKLEILKQKWTGKVLWARPKLSFERGRFVGKRGVPGLLAHFTHFRGAGGTLAQMGVLAVVSGLLGMASPILSQLLFDRVLTYREEDLLHALLFAILGMSVFGAMLGLVQSVMATHFSLRLDYRLHLSYFDHLLRLPVGTLETRLSGDLVSRFGDLSKIRAVLSEFVIAVPTNILMLIFGYGLLFTYNTKLALLTMLAIPIYLIQVIFLWPKLRENSRAIMKKSAEASSFVLAALDGIHSLKALRGETWSFAKSRNQTSGLTSLNWQNALFGMWGGVGIGLLNQLFSLLMLWYGAGMVLRLELTVGQLVAAYGIMGNAMGALGGLVGLVGMLQEGSVASDRLAEIVELSPEKSTSTNSELAPLQTEVIVENLSFAYANGAKILDGASFSMPKGSYTALLGNNGSGKSTLASLFARMMEPTAGKIMWDGRDLCSKGEIAPDQVRERVVYLRQEVPLLYATLRENLVFSREVSDETLWMILDAVGLGKVAKRLPEGLETVIGGESIFRLSTGEKQTLGLARALLCPADLLILDEPTATLDPDREEQVVQLLAALKGHKTFLVITHRPALLGPADQVLTLSNGQITQSTPSRSVPTEFSFGEQITEIPTQNGGAV